MNQAARARHELLRSVSAVAAEAIVQAHLGSVDAVEAVVKAKRSAGKDGPRRGCHRAAGLEPATVVEADEHVLALDAPALGECPFKSAADRPRGNGLAARGGDQPVAASNGGVLARIEHRSLSSNESSAALDVEQRAVPGVSQPAGHHAVPIADLRAPQYVKDRLRADDGTGIKGVATQTHVAGFAFKAEHEGRVDRLPVAAERAAADETAAQVGVPRVSRYEPRRHSAARIRQKRRHGDRSGGADTVLALVGECCAVASLPRAADVTAEIAAGPTEGRNHRRRLPHGEVSGGGRTDCGRCGKGYASEQKLFHVEPPTRNVAKCSTSSWAQ